MAEYRTIRMSFWTDPYIEGLPSEGKLLYLYLFTCPLVSNLGTMETTVKRIAYETDLDINRVSELLEKMEKDGKLVRDGNLLWLVNFIKNQCTTSPLLIKSMKSTLQDVPSSAVRKAICIRYPHIFECPENKENDTDTNKIPYQYPSDTVYIPSGEVKTGNIELKENTNVFLPKSGDFDATAEQGSLVETPSHEYPRCPQEKILSLYREILPELSQPRQVRPNIAQQVRARWVEKCREKGFASEEDGLEYFRKFFNYVAGNDFLTGRKASSNGRTWRCDYEWLMKARNFDRVTSDYYGGQA